jgi:hypothetical protein
MADLLEENDDYTHMLSTLKDLYNELFYKELIEKMESDKKKLTEAYQKTNQSIDDLTRKLENFEFQFSDIVDRNTKNLAEPIFEELLPEIKSTIVEEIQTNLAKYHEIFNVLSNHIEKSNTPHESTEVIEARLRFIEEKLDADRKVRTLLLRSLAVLAGSQLLLIIIFIISIL